VIVGMAGRTIELGRSAFGLAGCILEWEFAAHQNRHNGVSGRSRFASQFHPMRCHCIGFRGSVLHDE
jgi:hypothetical protein